MAWRIRGWRMARRCSDCPFSPRGAGAHLRRTLRGSRWKGILTSLLRGDHFFCHQTTEFDDDESGEATVTPKARICAGAIRWQARRGIVAQVVEVCERLDEFAKGSSGE
jgi:hypothetical protein